MYNPLSVPPFQVRKQPVFMDTNASHHNYAAVFCRARFSLSSVETQTFTSEQAILANYITTMTGKREL